MDREWQKLMTSNLPQMRTSATRWRDGLAALITIVTTGLVIAGPDNISDLPDAWRWWIVGLMVGGLAAVLGGLFCALLAAAGRPRKLTREVFGTTWKTVAAIEAHDAQAAWKDLRLAQGLASIGMLSIIVGTGVWLLTPAASSDPAAHLQVTTATEVLCGVLDSGDQNLLVVKVDGEKRPVELSYSDVVNLRVVGDCPVARSPR